MTYASRSIGTTPGANRTPKASARGMGLPRRFRTNRQIRKPTGHRTTYAPRNSAPALPLRLPYLNSGTARRFPAAQGRRKRIVPARIELSSKGANPSNKPFGSRRLKVNRSSALLSIPLAAALASASLDPMPFCRNAEMYRPALASDSLRIPLRYRSP
jgi:hypothetical protein